MIGKSDAFERRPQQVVRAFFDRVWNAREFGLLDEIVSPDCKTNQLQSGQAATSARRGPDAVKEHVEDWLRAFPDFRATIQQMLSEGDKVATQCVFDGTHKDVWLGIPASGIKLNIQMMVVHEARKGKIVEDWVLVDSYGIFHQLGLLPSMEKLLSH